MRVSVRIGQGVYVPEMCVELTTRRVLVMEWVDGVRLRSAATGSALPRGRDDLRLVEIGVHCSLEQVRWLLGRIRGFRAYARTCSWSRLACSAAWSRCAGCLAELGFLGLTRGPAPD